MVSGYRCAYRLLRPRYCCRARLGATVCGYSASLHCDEGHRWALPALDGTAPLEAGHPLHGDDVPLATTKRVLRDSFLVEVLNPKTALFFVAFLPQFVQPDSAIPVAWQLLWLGIATNVLFSSADVMVVLLASPLREWLQKSHGSSRLIQRIGGGVLMGLGSNTLAQAAR